MYNTHTSAEGTKRVCTEALTDKPVRNREVEDKTKWDVSRDVCKLEGCCIMCLMWKSALGEDLFFYFT